MPDPKRPESRIAKLTRALAAPDFPEIHTYEPRCRICKFAKSHPELLRVTNQLWQKGIREKSLERQIAILAPKYGERPVSMSTFRRHYKNHACFDLTVRVAREAVPRTEPDEEGSCYFEMWSLYQKVKSFVDEFDAKEFITKHEDGRFDFQKDKVEIWIKIMAEARSCIRDLHQLRSSERLINLILEAHTKTFAQQLVDPLVTYLETLEARLRQTTEPDALADEVAIFYKEGLLTIFQQSAHTALDQSRTKYRLH